MPRSHVYNAQGGMIVGYRGTAATPVSPYAFQTTPHLRQENRTASAPVNPYTQQGVGNAPVHKQGHPSVSSVSTTSSTTSSNRSLPGQHIVSKDDSVLGAAPRFNAGVDSRPTSSITLSTSVPDLSLSSFEPPVKSSPDRYRRVSRRTDSNISSPASQQHEIQPVNRPSTPSGTGMSSVAHLYRSGDGSPGGSPSRVRMSNDDMQTSRQGLSEQAKRYRRRSGGGLEPSAPGGMQAMTVSPSGSRPPSMASRQEVQPMRPSLHERAGSGDSLSSVSTGVRPTSRPDPSYGTAKATMQPASAPVRHQIKTVNIPARGSSDLSKRVGSPSPLSRPVAMEPENPPVTGAPRKTGTNMATSSPAAQHLTALSDKDLNKGMKSRLRRAFSFGSAQELRKASAENSMTAERARLRKEKYENDREALHAAVAAKQEAAGIGAGIYSGQGGIFTGSTDNLSISSTASSASIMLRKMGKGMKKSTRSLKGLFRPKSVVGVPAADGPVVQPSSAQVSRTTVEAEREKVNVNANPHDQPGGGTGFPKLERNSLDAASVSVVEAPLSSHGSVSSADAWSRRSVVGGEKERAEVLAAVKKGILKRKSPIMLIVSGVPLTLLRYWDKLAYCITGDAAN